MGDVLETPIRFSEIYIVVNVLVFFIVSPCLPNLIFKGNFVGSSLRDSMFKISMTRDSLGMGPNPINQSIISSNQYVQSFE